MTESTFEPGRLRLARDLRGISQADLATALGLTPAALSQFESGATRPSADNLARLADSLVVPKSFFGLALIETHEGFFRSLRRTTVADRRRARAIAHVAHDAARLGASGKALPNLALPIFPVSSLDVDEDEIEGFAERLRRSWDIAAGPAPNMVELLEAHGIVVIRLPLETSDVDAFSLPFPDRPVIVLGSDKNDRARSRFDAAHELGHLVIHDEQVWGLPEVEKQAHQFAAAFLMPRADIEASLPSRLDWQVLFELKKQWQVSLAALLMRARTLGRMTEATYLAGMKAMSTHGWRRIEPVPLGSPEVPRKLSKLLDADTLNELRVFLPADGLKTILAGLS